MHVPRIDLTEYRSSSRIVGIVFFCLLAIVSAQPADQFVTLVDSFKVRIRATPQILPDNILDSLLKGTQLPTTGEENGWYRVILTDGRIGWVHGDYVKVEEARDQAEIVYEVVRVRAEPSIESDSIARAIKGQRLHFLEKVDDWLKVEIPNETEGWVREDTVLLRPAKVESAPELPAASAEDSLPADESQKTERAEVNEGDLDSEETVSNDFVQEEVSFPVSRTPVSADPGVVTEAGRDWFMMTVIAALLTGLVIGITVLLRQRRMKSVEEAIKTGRSDASELERTLVHEMKKARTKTEGLEKQIESRLKDFGTSAGLAGPAPRTLEESLNSLEELRGIIQSQQERLDLYSELVSLQNEQIESYRQENRSIRKLLELRNKPAHNSGH